MILQENVERDGPSALNTTSEVDEMEVLSLCKEYIKKTLDVSV